MLRRFSLQAFFFQTLRLQIPTYANFQTNNVSTRTLHVAEAPKRFRLLVRVPDLHEIQEHKTLMLPMLSANCKDNGSGCNSNKKLGLRKRTKFNDEIMTSYSERQQPWRQQGKSSYAVTKLLAKNRFAQQKQPSKTKSFVNWMK